MESEKLEYVGFWARTGASILDTVLIVAITMPVLYAVYGEQYFVSETPVSGVVDILLSWVFPAVAVIWFWVAKQATPGKMAIGAKIVDARTGRAVSTGKAVGRYLGYFVSTIPLGLGILWVAFDPKKQGWHDKLAGTVVVRRKDRSPEEVVFE